MQDYLKIVLEQEFSKQGPDRTASHTFLAMGNRLPCGIIVLKPVGLDKSDRGVNKPEVAQHEHEREDLIRTATALVQRVELAMDGFSDLLVIGFRRNGAVSLYLGEDPVYQFNRSGELRRAYRGGKLVKAESGKLVELSRQSGERRVGMEHRELSDLETDQFLSQLHQRLDWLRVALEENRYRVTDQFPADGETVARARRWLAELPDSISVARVANVR